MCWQGRLINHWPSIWPACLPEPGDALFVLNEACRVEGCGVTVTLPAPPQLPRFILQLGKV